MFITLPIEKINDRIMNQFSQIDLILSPQLSQQEQLKWIEKIINSKRRLFLTAARLESQIELLNQLPGQVYLSLLVDQDNQEEIIYYHKLLRRFRTVMKIKGEWNRQTIHSIKKMAHLRFNILIYFTSLESINQTEYEKLFQFIFLNPLLFSQIEPFQSLLHYFIDPAKKIDLYQIYNEIPGRIYYYAHENYTLGLLWKEKEKLMGRFNRRMTQFEGNGLFDQVLKWYQNDGIDNPECLNCTFKKLCRGYIINLYDHCQSEWKEIFSTVQDLAHLLKKNPQMTK